MTDQSAEPLAEAEVLARIHPGRTITGMSAVLLPFTADGDIDWGATEAHIARTVDAGLTPAVNMDTGYVQLLTDAHKTEVLELAAAVAGDGFVAGAYVADEPGAAFDLPGHVAACEAVAGRGGTPVIFPSYGLNGLDDDGWVDALSAIGTQVERFIGFELGAMFVPYGRIPSLDAYEAMMGIESCIGAKHSSLSRQLEWDRLAARDRLRPEFRVFTGNDLAIDMVMYGSDYLLGLSTFAPEAFALRDRMWANCDPRFHELNDLLQYLGHFTFRAPVPGYRHDAAMSFELRGWASSSNTPSGAPQRPESDRAVLADILERIDAWTSEEHP
ncbi:MAG TPA: dihydrodipicolinate synthase family protein [Ilumatobacteraceae bacterium]|nr:dihydrodipicolinate synthase family protein [Ilumatobacteraceae bacterium]